MIAAAETTLQVEITVQLLTLKATSRNCHLPSNSSTPIQTSLWNRRESPLRIKQATQVWSRVSKRRWMIWPRYSRHRRHHRGSWIYQTKVRKYDRSSNFIDLSDMHSAEIAKCLKNHGHHLRTLNLARNRLTDEGIGQVVRAVCDTQIESLDI